eukprot:3393224-Lingulodinium_polyedra.AAC.1
MVRATRAICEPLQQRNAFPNALLSNFRAKADQTCDQKRAKTDQKCVQKCIRLLRRNAFRDSRTPCVDHRVVVDAWSA